MTEAPDVSVVIPAHYEGRLANHTLASIFRANEYCRTRGMDLEVLVILDRPDAKTRDYFARTPFQPDRLEEVDFGDLGLTRNYGVSVANAGVIAFVDADNLVGETWFYNGFHFLKSRIGEIIVHPEYVVVFEAENSIWRQISSNDPAFRAGDFIENNFWDATCMAKVEVLRRFPYQSTMATRGFGYEDWHFNCETLAAGIDHLVVPNTALFLRKKRTGSLLAETNLHRRVIRPSRLFDLNVFQDFVRPESPHGD
jgi:hypothetical protein